MASKVPAHAVRTCIIPAPGMWAEPGNRGRVTPVTGLPYMAKVTGHFHKYLQMSLEDWGETGFEEVSCPVVRGPRG